MAALLLAALAIGGGFLAFRRAVQKRAANAALRRVDAFMRQRDAEDVFARLEAYFK